MRPLHLRKESLPLLAPALSDWKGSKASASEWETKYSERCFYFLKLYQQRRRNPTT